MSAETQWELTKLNKKEEQKFQQWIKQTPWYNEFTKNYGEEPNLNDTNYDYRKAWKSGVEPVFYEPTGTYHWSSKTPQGEWLKSPDHPTAWMETFMQKYGVDPMQLSVNMNTPQNIGVDFTKQLMMGKR